MSQSVLIVDADQGFTDSAQFALEERGVVVHVRDDAPLDLIRKLRPTVMMLNIELPKGATTGLSICSRIRRDRELRMTPILLTTSGASADMLKKHAQSTDKADDYARKPIAVDDVVARLDKLLAAAPPAPEPKNGEAHEASTADLAPPDGEFDVDDQTEVKRGEKTETSAQVPPPRSPTITAPPLTPKSAPANPALPLTPKGAPANPALPPPSKSTAGTAPPLPPPSRSTAGTLPGAPPPLKREITIAPNTTADDLWRPQRIEEALRGLLDVQEPQAPAKATPEDRLAYLRQLVKYYESRDKAFREAWSTTQVLGQDLAKRAVSLAIEADRREKRIEEIAGERDATQHRLTSIETEFKAFQDEITRIFRDKDSEEQATYGRLSQLETDNTKLKKDLETATEQNKDHERRLQIFQDEIEALQVEKDDAEAKVIELASSLDDAHSTSEDLRARLETTETVASERADDIEKLREQLDRIALDAGQERQRLVAAHETTLSEKEAEHNVAIETLEADQRAAIAALIKRHEELLETLTQTQESEVGSLEGARAELTQRVEALTKNVAELEKRLRDDGSAHAAEVGQLRAELESIEAARDSLTGDLETTTTLYTAVIDERDSLTKELESTKAELAGAQKRVEEQDASLDVLEATLEREKKELSERIAELEEELDGAQNESFERLAELERLKKTHDKVATKAQNLETSLKISEKALGVAETRGKAIESENAVMKARDDELSRQNAELEAQQKRLETSHQENVAMLERERERFSRAEDLLIKAKDRIGELTKETEASSKRIGELEDEAARKEAELAEAYAAVTDAERRLADATRAHEEEVAKLRPDAEAARARVEALERDLRALEATEQALLKEIDLREEKIGVLESEAAASSTRASAVEVELQAERVRAQGFSQLSTQQSEMMRRIVASLGAGLDVLARPRSSDELMREALEDRPPRESRPPPAVVQSPAPPPIAQSAPPAPPAPPPQPTQSSSPPPERARASSPEPKTPPAKPSRSKRNMPPPLPPKASAAPTSPAKPFAALVNEAASKPSGFDESFAEESTTTDGPSLRRFDSVDGLPGPRDNATSPWDLPKLSRSPTKKQNVYESEEQELEHLAELLGKDDEDSERNITEIVRLDKLK